MEYESDNRHSGNDRIPTDDGRFVRPGIPPERRDAQRSDIPIQDELFRKAQPVPDPTRPAVRKPDMKRLLERMERGDSEQAEQTRHWRDH